MKKTLIAMIGTAAILVSCNTNTDQSKTVSVQKDSMMAAVVTKDTTQHTKPLSGKVPLDGLSAKAKEYVSQNYKGYNITGAAYDPLCAGGDAIDVSVAKKGSTTLSLIFLPDGTFIQQEEDVDISKAPASVITSVKAKYSDYKPAAQIERLILADKTVQYLLDITKGKLTREVIFKEDGSIVCQSKEE